MWAFILREGGRNEKRLHCTDRKVRLRAAVKIFRKRVKRQKSKILQGKKTATGDQEAHEGQGTLGLNFYHQEKKFGAAQDFFMIFFPEVLLPLLLQIGIQGQCAVHHQRGS